MFIVLKLYKFNDVNELQVKNICAKLVTCEVSKESKFNDSNKIQF